MSTPPTGEDPQRAPGPDGTPTTPHQPGTSPYPQPGYGQPGYGQPPPAYPQQGFGAAPPGQQPSYVHYGQPASPPWQPGQQPSNDQYGQPAPPPWQPATPQAPPHGRRRKGLLVALVLVALAIVGSVATLVYLLSATRLDRTAVEDGVASQFEEREGVALELECRQRMIVRPGAAYDCDGTTADGEEVEIVITITDDQGAYTWAED